MPLQKPGAANEQPDRGASGTLEQVRFRTRQRQMKADQNPVLGLLAGAVAAIIGAVAWAFITFATNQMIGLVAVGIGLLVGFAVRIFGKGMTRVFGVIGASLSLLGCLAGNLLSSCMLISKQESIPLPKLLSQLNLQAITELMTTTFRPMDLAFYAIAAYMGYQYSFTRTSPEESEKEILS